MEPTLSAAPETTVATPVEEPGRFAFWRGSLIIFVVWFVIDHATKLWAEAELKPAPGTYPESIHIIHGFFALTYAENTGAAFSILTGKTGFLAVLSLLVSGMLLWFWYTLPAADRWSRGAIALILSGAIGNVIDRILRGYVVDFFHAYWRDHHWPIFNVADSCICIGAGMIIWKEVRTVLAARRTPPAT